MEGLDVLNPSRGFWRDRPVLVTGHTGFKGAWLSLWLAEMGAKVTGVSLGVPTSPSLFELTCLHERLEDLRSDVRDLSSLSVVLQKTKPEVVFHLAAQSLVRASYDDPVGTYTTNVLGTANLLEAVRRGDSVRSVVVVTTDKCYENKEWPWGYRESDTLGGHDPYSSSKACCELVTAAYRRSFFGQSTDARERCVGIATARAGNVIGGGDWARDRLIPDCLNALIAGRRIEIRNPHATRPWQHVLEPLSGYLTLAERLLENDSGFSESWNFGPDDADVVTVGQIVNALCRSWGVEPALDLRSQGQPHEAHSLKLDCSKARQRLAWTPRMRLGTALDWVVEWTRAHVEGGDVRGVCLDQIDRYLTLVPAIGWESEHPAQ